MLAIVGGFAETAVIIIIVSVALATYRYQKEHR